MIKVITNVTLRVGHGQSVEYAPPGTEVDLEEKDAKALIDRGFVSSIKEKNQVQTVNAPPKPSIDDIIEVIIGLDPEQDYGKTTGKPNVDAIEALLGANISGAERDAAWDKYQTEIADTPS